MKFFIAAALAVTGLTPPSAVHAQSAQGLSVNTAAAKTAARDLPTCSKTVTTNCKERGKNGTWIVVGAVGVALAVAVAAAGGKKKSVSP